MPRESMRLIGILRRRGWSSPARAQNRTGAYAEFHVTQAGRAGGGGPERVCLQEGQSHFGSVPLCACTITTDPPSRETMTCLLAPLWSAFPTCRSKRRGRLRPPVARELLSTNLHTCAVDLSAEERKTHAKRPGCLPLLGQAALMAHSPAHYQALGRLDAKRENAVGGACGCVPGQGSWRA